MGMKPLPCSSSREGDKKHRRSKLMGLGDTCDLPCTSEARRASCLCVGCSA